MYITYTFCVTRWQVVILAMEYRGFGRSDDAEISEESMATVAAIVGNPLSMKVLMGKWWIMMVNDG